MSDAKHDRQQSEQDKNYTAVLFFHGMGTPRRYEEISRLTDALDQFAEHENSERLGRFRAQTVVLEPNRIGTDDEDDLAYVRLIRVRQSEQGHKFRAHGHIRIYESFWSPSAAGKYSAWRVLLWLFSRISNPLVVLTRPWRAHQRLKLAWLYRLYFDENDGPQKEIFPHLEKHYRQFENWAARRKYRYGWYWQFVQYLKEKEPPERLANTLELARRWHTSFLARQWLTIWLGITTLVASIDVLGAVFNIVIAWVALISRKPQFLVLVSWIPSDFLNSRISIGLLSIVSILTMFLIYRMNKFLSSFLADVMYWTVQGEKDVRFAKRRDILDASSRVLRHILADPQCTRLVVVAHSLGTAIAHECLMHLGRRFIARQLSVDCPLELRRLNIVSHFITVASPIDRIHYFFELQNSRFHRYNRIREDVRGDTSRPPFTLGGRRNTTWLNLWDDADPVSSRLYSPRQHMPNRSSIRDIKVISSFRPNFLSAHNDYLFSVEAMREICGAIALNSSPAALLRKPSGWELLLKGAGRRLAWITILFLPWSLFTWTFVPMLRGAGYDQIIHTPSIIISGLCVVTLLILNIVGKIADLFVPTRTDGRVSDLKN